MRQNEQLYLYIYYLIIKLELIPDSKAHNLGNYAPNTSLTVVIFIQYMFASDKTNV